MGLTSGYALQPFQAEPSAERRLSRDRLSPISSDSSRACFEGAKEKDVDVCHRRACIVKTAIGQAQRRADRIRRATARKSWSPGD